MSGLVKKDNYICIQGWMLSDLSLSGTELIIYAIIYGFSQDGNSAFAGTLSYLMQWSNTSKNTVLKALRSLMNMRLITKTEDTVSGVKVCRYTAVRSSSGMDSTDSKAEPGVQKLNGSGAETEPGVQKLNGSGAETEPGVQKLNGGGAETEPNNLNNNLNNNLGYSDNKTGISQHGGVKPSADVPSAGVPSNVKICSEFDTLWSQYPEGRKQGRMQALAKYTQVRNKEQAISRYWTDY